MKLYYLCLTINLMYNINHKNITIFLNDFIMILFYINTLQYLVTIMNNILKNEEKNTLTLN